MDSTHSLEAHLTQFLNPSLPSLDDSNQKIEREKDLSLALELGTTTLSEEPHFSAELMDYFAKEIGTPESFEQFKKRLGKSLSAPNKNDPLLDLEARRILSKIAPEKKHNETALGQAKQILHTKKVMDYATQKKEADALGGHLKPNLESYFSSSLRSLPEHFQTFFSAPRNLPITEFYRHRHTLITGGTGSGKSEITKTIAHHYLTKNPRTALVVVDPHGSLAEDIAQFEENAETNRLLYVDLTLKKGVSPVLNPFEVGELSEADFDIVSGQIVNLLGVMLSEDNQFTDQMKAVLKPCVETLLKLPDTNLEHLKQFFDEERNDDLKRQALLLLSNPSDRDFMKRDFDSSSYAPTKQSIRTRLHLLLTQERFRNFVVGKSTIDLKSAVDARKVICFKITGQDSNDPVVIALGRLVVGSLLAMTMRRGILSSSLRDQESPIHLMIDEAHNFSHPTLATILGESRKYKLYLTLISQFIGKFPHAELRNEIESNIGLKIAGWQSPNSKGGAANEKLLGIANESLGNLRTGEFYVKALSGPAFRIQNSSRLVGSKHAMSSEQWQTITKDQLQRYYRPIQTPEEAEEGFSYSSRRTKPSHSPTLSKQPLKPHLGTDSPNPFGETPNDEQV